MNPIQPTQSQSQSQPLPLPLNQDHPATTLDPHLAQILHRHHIPTHAEITSQRLCRTCEAQWSWQLLFRIIDPEDYTPYTKPCIGCRRVGFVESMVERGVTRENEMRAAEGVELVPKIGNEARDWAGGRAGGFVLDHDFDSNAGDSTGTGTGTNPRRRPQARGHPPGETGSPSSGFPASLTRSSELRVGDVGMGFYENENGDVDVGTGEIVRISRERVDIGLPRHPGESPVRYQDSSGRSRQ
ncbi:hypothetical protein BDW69DRAFT_187884 [Aspergillus filifer]